MPKPDPLAQRAGFQVTERQREEIRSLHVGQVLCLPGGVVAARERTAVIHLDRQKKRAAGADVELHAGIRRRHYEP